MGPKNLYIEHRLIPEFNLANQLLNVLPCSMHLLLVGMLPSVEASGNILTSGEHNYMLQCLHDRTFNS